MPLLLERNDLAKMEVDAVVLPANPWLEEGRGTSRALFKAAGQTKLEEACQRIGHVDYGEAVMTSGFDLPARYIIHAVVPLFTGEDSEEAVRQLYSCYTKSLRLAARRGLSSVAFPLLSSGSFHWPKADALRIANRAIVDFFSGSKQDEVKRNILGELTTEPADMTVYLVLYDNESTSAAENLYGEIQKYIDDNYVEATLDELPDFPDFFLAEEHEELVEETETEAERDFAPTPTAMPQPMMNSAPAAAPEEPVARKRGFTLSGLFGFREKVEEELEKGETAAEGFVPEEPVLEPDEAVDESLEDILEKKVESFNDVLIRLVNESGMTNPEIYLRANMSKQQFSKIISNKVVPKKTSIFALAVALMLDIENTELLLMKAGYAFSDSSLLDLIVKYSIIHESYNILTINEILFKYNQNLLGSSVA